MTRFKLNIRGRLIVDFSVLCRLMARIVGATMLKLHPSAFGPNRTNESKASCSSFGLREAALDTGAAAQQVVQASHDLSEQSETMRARVEPFLGDAKAALTEADRMRRPWMQRVENSQTCSPRRSEECNAKAHLVSGY